MSLSLSLLVGLALLGVGGDILVRGAVGLATALRVSPLFTGLVLVGFGTSMPELVTSVNATLQGSPGIAMGNIIGSNIANILLILGLTAIIVPIPADPRSFRRDAPMLALATVACVFVMQFGYTGRMTGALFLIALAAYVLRTFRSERRQHDASATLHEQEGRLVKPAGSGAVSFVLAMAGLTAILFGADILVKASVKMAAGLGVPDSVIGLTIVAVGTSLPELATSLTAAFRRQTDIALGNIIGSNIFNLLGILGATILVQPIRIAADVIGFDAWVMLGVTGLLLYFTLTGARITRMEGLVFVALYAAYIVLIASRAVPQ